MDKEFVNIEKQTYKILPIFSTNNKTIEIAIKNAFFKYIKYNDYK